jgi:hypothetical protein
MGSSIAQGCRGRAPKQLRPLVLRFSVRACDQDGLTPLDVALERRDATLLDQLHKYCAVRGITLPVGFADALWMSRSDSHLQSSVSA